MLICYFVTCIVFLMGFPLFSKVFLIILCAVLLLPYPKSNAVVYPDAVGFTPDVPFTVALFTSDSGKKGLVCSGVLLNKSWVLTAAHCVTNYDIKSVVSSEFFVSKKEVFIPTRIVYHSEYDPSTKLYDIALIQLDRPVDYIDVFPIVASNDSSLINFEFLEFQGFGVNEKGFAPTGVASGSGSFSLDSGFSSLPYFDPDLLLSLTSFSSKTCVGDSGGPLFARFASNFYVVGVSSFGSTNCSDPAPMFFTRVSSFSDWIDSTISTP